MLANILSVLIFLEFIGSGWVAWLIYNTPPANIDEGPATKVLFFCFLGFTIALVTSIYSVKRSKMKVGVRVLSVITTAVLYTLLVMSVTKAISMG